MDSRKCIICGKDFIPTHSKQQYCSKKCASIKKAETQKANRIKKICETCGKEFYVTNSGLHKKYCCRRCADIGRTTQVKKICEYCGKEYFVIKQREGVTRYCCRDCSDKAKIGIPNCTCPMCGKVFHRKPYHLQKFGHTFGCYCSKECLNKARKILFRGEKNHQYGLKGALNASYNGDIILQKNHKLIEKMVYCPMHPYCNHSGRVKEHRLIVEQNHSLFNSSYFTNINGQFYLLPEIVVHHLDGDHNNNDVSNLCPCTKKEHRQYHKPVITKRDMKGRILETAVLKQGELLGSPEVGNQQPSTPLTKCEGSETRC